MVERVALETNASIWAAIGHCVENKLVPGRACSALEKFKTLIEDARAMLFPQQFVEKFWPVQRCACFRRDRCFPATVKTCLRAQGVTPVVPENAAVPVETHGRSGAKSERPVRGDNRTGQAIRALGVDGRSRLI